MILHRNKNLTKEIVFQNNMSCSSAKYYRVQHDLFTSQYVPNTIRLYCFEPKEAAFTLNKNQFKAYERMNIILQYNLKYASNKKPAVVHSNRRISSGRKRNKSVAFDDATIFDQTSISRQNSMETKSECIEALVNSQT